MFTLTSTDRRYLSWVKLTLSTSNISLIWTNVKSPWNFLKILFFPFRDWNLCNSKISIVQTKFQVPLGRFSVIRTFLHSWQVKWPLSPSNGLSSFVLFFRMFRFLIKTIFKLLNTSPWYMERWRRGFTKSKT